MPRTVTPEPTPNPNATRFSLGEDALGGASRSFADPAAAAGTPWAEKLFEIGGVVSLFGVKDFVTVTKEAHTGWEAIVPHVIEVLETAEF